MWSLAGFLVCFVLLGFFFFAMEWIYYHFLYVKTLFTSMHNVFLYKILQILEQKIYIYFQLFQCKSKGMLNPKHGSQIGATWWEK